jgi:outer membrane protein TolC
MVGLANSYLIPKFSSFVDLGSQGYDFKVNDKTAYAFLGLSLEWNLFAGGKNLNKVKQAQLEESATTSQISYVEQQLKLQLTVSQNNFQSLVGQYKAACTQVASAQKYYADLLNLYKEGQAMFIELLDAQNQLISAQLQKNISLYDTWMKQAEVERANASYTIK